ncbi:hypothetical protein B0H13DRAFT_2479225 [Mycena leptocephala]|nr:hypothetical protein B0H13DRAFT_2479225 [Mycena leptocephala]
MLCASVDLPLIEPRLPLQLCDMLLHNPDLEHLRLELRALYNILEQVSRLMHGTWRNLSSFHIEMYSSLNAHHPTSDELGAFLASHPTITSLSILAYLPAIPLVLSRTTLPHLTSFTGLAQHLSALPSVDFLWDLVLTDDGLAADPSQMIAALQRLTFLNTLKLNLGDAARVSVLSSVISACPYLGSLDISYSTPCSMKQLKAIAVELHSLTSLRHLSLQKIFRFVDGTMLAAALLLLAQNPGLRHIHLVWVTAKVWKQSGNYTVHSREDATDVPYSLEAKERGPRALGGSFTRRFRYVLDGGDTVSKGLARMRL